MNDKTANKKSCGVFSLKSPVGHWLYQRVSALALAPLSLWSLLLLSKVRYAPYAETLDWLSSPVNAAAVVTWLVLAFFHAALGVQVVIEDYVSTVPIRKLAILCTHLIFLLLGLAVLAAMTFILSTR